MCGRMTLSGLGLGLVAMIALPIADDVSAQQLPSRANHTVTLPGAVQKPSLGDSLGSSIKSGLGKVTHLLKPKSSPPTVPDPISLEVKAEPDPNFYVAMAKMAEQSGKVGQARQNYESALKLDPHHYGALLNYARLKDRQGRLDEATRLYQQATKANPNSAAAWNDLGLCLARRRLLHESVRTLEKAIQLQPRETLYRNNIATVLVELNEVDAAHKHLRAVHTEAAADYNLGYLLQKRGQIEPARRLFAEALARDPSLGAARAWLKKLGGPPAAKASVARRLGNAASPKPRLGSPTGLAPLPPTLVPRESLRGRPATPGKAAANPTSKRSSGGVWRLPPTR